MDDRGLLAAITRLRELDARRWEHRAGGEAHERLLRALEAQRLLVQRCAQDLELLTPSAVRSR
jgi:hypothetical protein